MQRPPLRIASAATAAAQQLRSNLREPKPAGTRGPPGGESTAIKELKAEIAALRTSVGGHGQRAVVQQQQQSDLSYSQVLQILRQNNIDEGAIFKVQEKHIADQEGKPTSAIAAQHRVENSRKKIEQLEQRVSSYKEQRDEQDRAIADNEKLLQEARVELERNIKVSHRVHMEQVENPIELGFAGLSESVKTSQKGRVALDQRRRLQKLHR